MNTANDSLIDAWIEGFRNPKTRAAYSFDLQQFAAWLKGPLLSAKRKTLNAYAKRLTKARCQRTGRPLSVSAQRRALSALCSFYRHAAVEELIAKNPADGLKLPTAKDDLAERIITEEEYFELVMTAKKRERTHGKNTEKNNRDALLIELLYATGGRISEALGARWKDTQARKKGGQITLFGKRAKTRNVLIPAATWKKLLASRKDAPDSAFVFPSPRDASKPLSASQAWRIVKEIAAVAGFGKLVTPHWFRHAHASHAIERGAPLPLVRDTLGHSDLRTTSRYSHARPDDSSGMYLSIK